MDQVDQNKTFLEFKKVVEEHFSGENVTPESVYQATLEFSRIAKSCAPTNQGNIDES